MSDKSSQLSIEILQSKAVLYFVIGLFVLLILYSCKSWFRELASAVSQKYLAEKKPSTR
jgi:hypothetical protein